MFVTGEPIQLSLMFASKVGAYQSATPASLLSLFVGEAESKFYYYWHLVAEASSLAVR